MTVAIRLGYDPNALYATPARLYRASDLGCTLSESLQRRKLVGTTRFELATSPTPRVRSTRLSHVPTCCKSVGQEGRARVPLVYTK
jgi:hypothetical protein